ncbi:type IV pilus modification protein PilV [Vibrio sp. B1REV9]|uniref:type IV pilus modification PilV family protein n=1 Tax=Vibrio sp. B1REV9 TaxID=2751179 RepID=UPI001B045F75|nr:prepilin-type N-terminal cleavage/methylation domain-containing protein [Vibrio sp. B1REV9]CAE6954922.1 type IV pilus modification protein PilV [Vibrio sp. B1REV9]
MTSKQQGISLIEVLMTFLLIGVGALGLIKWQAYMEREADYAINSINALRAAENQLEWFHTRGASGALSTIPVVHFDSIATGSNSIGPYHVQWNVSSPTGSASLKTIVITSSWQDRMGRTKSIKLETKITRYSEFDE